VTSIVITTYNRNPQLFQTLVSIRRQGFDGEVIVVDNGDLSIGHPSAQLVCEAHGVRHIALHRPPSAVFRNPSYPMNVGIRAATGEVVILQNAECLHVDPRAIAKLSSIVLVPASSSPRAVFARVVALNPDGSETMVYCGPENPRPYFFCGAMRREWFLQLRGFDEDYTGAGYEDDDFAVRLQRAGCQFLFTDVAVSHQWHPQAGELSDAPAMQTLYRGKTAAMLRGELGVTRNIGRNWGGQP
jgi:GT2 family glycosyltransferase